MYKICMMMVLLLLLSGCRIELSLDEGAAGTTAARTSTEARSEGNNVQQDEPLSVFLNGDVEYNETQITLKLYTELEEGTFLKVSLREYPKDASLRDIANDKVDPVEEPVFEETVEVQNGDLDLPIEREAGKVYTLTVEFKPEIQPEELKEVYGSRGENIVIASNIYNYKHQGETMIGVKASSYIGLSSGWGMLE
jgi:hypothetical protein